MFLSSRGRPWIRTSLGLLTLLSTSSGSLGARPFPGQESPPSFEEALAQYEKEIEREAFMLRTWGREVLAYSGDPRAFQRLRADYARPEDFDEFTRCTLIELLRRYGRVDLSGEWPRWREAFDDDRDAWMWYRALLGEHDTRPGQWLELAAGLKSIPLRSAAIRAGGDASPGLPFSAEELESLVRIVEGAPRRDLEGSMLLLAVARGLESRYSGGVKEGVAPLLQALVGRFGDSAFSERTRILLSRSLARLLRCENVGLEASAWQAVIDGPLAGARGRANLAGQEKLDLSFFGLHGFGRRICYCIDASDSMMEPLTQRERASLQPLTGRGGGGGEAPREGGSLEGQLDWDRIESRFDAVREMLKLSISSMDADQEFCVVLFGDRASALDSTPKFVKAKSRTLDKVFAELDEVRGGVPTDERPHGRLWGMTNLHGALLLAHQLTGGRPVREQADIAAKGFRSGCDTIFLLSDGDPNWDNFDATDVNEGGTVSDIEAGRPAGQSATANWYGPFSLKRYLLADLERHLLLRNTLVHAVGIGEASPALLKDIADLGGGRVLSVGVAADAE